MIEGKTNFAINIPTKATTPKPIKYKVLDACVKSDKPKGCTPTATIATNKPTKNAIIKPLTEFIEVDIGFLNVAIKATICLIIKAKKEVIA